jgi:hypothetical protein
MEKKNEEQMSTGGCLAVSGCLLIGLTLVCATIVTVAWLVVS